jgi:hypothetical protein
LFSNSYNCKSKNNDDEIKTTSDTQNKKKKCAKNKIATKKKKKKGANRFSLPAPIGETQASKIHVTMASKIELWQTDECQCCRTRHQRLARRWTADWKLSLCERLDRTVSALLSHVLPNARMFFQHYHWRRPPVRRQQQRKYFSRRQQKTKNKKKNKTKKSANNITSTISLSFSAVTLLLFRTTHNRSFAEARNDASFGDKTRLKNAKTSFAFGTNTFSIAVCRFSPFNTSNSNNWSSLNQRSTIFAREKNEMTTFTFSLRATSSRRASGDTGTEHALIAVS